MRTFFIILLIGIIIPVCKSQKGEVSYYTPNVYIEKGDYYLGKKNYKKAIVYYNMALKKDANYYSILRKAEAYEALKLDDQAVECYRILFQTSYEVDNEYYLKYALLLLKTNNIKGYEHWLDRYNKNIEAEIKSKIASNKKGAGLYMDSAIIVVENESMLNTSESDICPVSYNNFLCFASTRKNLMGSKSNEYYNLYAAKYVKGGKLGKLNVFNKSINSKENESSVFFSDINNKMYFTRSTATGVLLRDENLKTYITNIPSNPDVKLNTNELIIGGVNGIGQVCFNEDGSKMYFASETPGGPGGFDIYVSKQTNGQWSTPELLGDNINTSKDELYPFLLNDTLLFFTSSGHSGLGGLDLYSVNLNQDGSRPVNLGNKVNSKFDDFCLTFAPGGLTGYFSSNRPGGFGKEDIYRLHYTTVKVKKPVFQFKRAPALDDKKINLYLSDGAEYNIASERNGGFDFSFQPEESYKMVIQHENPLASNIINDEQLTDEQRAKEFLVPDPFEKTEIELEKGMKYQFTVGMKPISDDYKTALNDMTSEYEGDKGSTIDLTALAKELLLKDGEIYTINFVKDEEASSGQDTEEVTQLFVNDKTLDVAGRSFFVVLPLDIEISFNIQTDLDYFREKYNPKKTGKVKLDTEPVIKEVPVKYTKGFPILVNTESMNEIGEQILAKELSIVPGTFYLFSLKKSFPGTDQKLEIFVPLTKGVKYNISKNADSESQYDKELSQMMSGKQSQAEEEELIDITVLSKELDISPDDSIIFSLMPVKPKGSQSVETSNVPTVLDADGRKYYIKADQKLKVQLLFEENKKLNLQTDLEYIKENFEASTIAIKVDKEALSKDVEKESKNIITDPVFDVIVVNFDLNQYSIRPDAKNILDSKVINELKGDERIYVTIKGYTDPLGDAELNEKLSKNRAQAVKDYLTSNGIGEGRIRTFSFGETLSLKEGEDWEKLSEAELQKHRKVEIVMYLPK